MSLANITSEIREFRDARNWMQFHNPKDMAIAISIESGELLELFLWKSPAEIESLMQTKRERVEDEIADIGIYLLELSDNLGVDLIEAMDRKLKKNSEKYPVEKANNSNKKYTEL